MKEVSEYITIDETLRFVLFGLQCALGVQFSGRECERVFTDSQNDGVSEKSYRFHESSGLIVRGEVEECEPETLILTVAGKKIDLADLIERSQYEVNRMRKAGGQKDPCD